MAATDANLHTVQSSFMSGELDPLMRMRTDIKSYYQGMKKGRNIALHAQGGFRRRPGTVFCAVLDNPTVLHEYSYGENQTYIFAFSNTKLKVFNSAGTLLTTLTGCPWDNNDINELTLTSSADTTIVCHQTFSPQRILRTGASTFTKEDFPFVADSSGAPKRQPYFKFAADAVTLTASATSGTNITLTTSADHFESGHAGTRIRYKSKELQIVSITNATTAVADVKETLPSTTATTDWDEQAWSTVNGFPRACTFHDQRLFFGGSTNRPDGIWGSKTNDFFNFDIGTALDDESIDVTVTGDRVAEVRHIVSSRNLQIFSDGAELFVPQDATKKLTPTNMQFLQQTPYGVSQKVNPVKFDGGTLFMQRTGKAIREYLFSDTEQAYTSGAVSLRSNHLIGTAVDSAALMGTEDRPEQFAFFVKSDGDVAVFHSARNEKIAGWTLWQTNGSYKSMTTCSDVLFAAVERTINGATVVWLEKFDWDVTLDAATKVAADADRITNGTFDTDTGWTKGTGWTVDASDSNKAACSGAQSSASSLSQSFTGTNGNVYKVKFTISDYSAGNVKVKVKNGSGTNVAQDGTHVQFITASSGSNFEFEADSNFVGKIDDVSVVEVSKSFTAAHLLNTPVEVTTNSAAQHAGSVTANGSGVATVSEFLNGADVGINYDITVETMPVDAVLRSGGAVTGQKKRISRVVISVIGTQSLNLSGNKLITLQSNDDFSNPPTAAEGDHQFFMLGFEVDPTITISQGQPLPITVLGLYAEVTA